MWIMGSGETEWFEFDWSDFLAPGETITLATIDCDANLQKLDAHNTQTYVAIRLTGGVNGTRSVISCAIDTSAGQHFETTKTINIVERVTT